MTTIYALGSGSSGNAFAVACDGAVLLVDAGFSARDTRKLAQATKLAQGLADALTPSSEA